MQNITWGFKLSEDEEAARKALYYHFDNTVDILTQKIRKVKVYGQYQRQKGQR